MNGIPATATIAPCAWMYARRPLRVEVMTAGSRVGFDSPILFDDATEADAIALALRTQVVPCVNPCAGHAVEDPSSNRGGRCNSCFEAFLNDRFQRDREAALRAASEKDATMKAKGYRYKASAWVHPESGSDYQIDVYFADAPTPAAMTKVLKKHKSVIHNDYQCASL